MSVIIKRRKRNPPPLPCPLNVVDFKNGKYVFEGGITCAPHNIVIDEVTGDVICTENGLILTERVPYEPLTLNPSYETGDEDRKGRSLNTEPLKQTKGSSKHKMNYGKRIKRDIRSLYLDGYPPREIAKKLKVPLTLVYNATRGLRKFKKYPALPASVKTRIINKVKEGKRVKEIAEEEGITPITVYSTIKEYERKYGEKIYVKYRRYSKEFEERVVRKYMQGKTQKEIAKEEGISANTVRRIIKRWEKEHGEIPRKRGRRRKKSNQ